MAQKTKEAMYVEDTEARRKALEEIVGSCDKCSDRILEDWQYVDERTTCRKNALTSQPLSMKSRAK